MAAMDEKYDSALLGILQSEGKVAPFLDTILGFLYRRTDYFRIMKTETDKLGFPPGVALKLLVNTFKKYESLSAKDQQRIEELKKAREKQAEKTKEKTELEQLEASNAQSRSPSQTHKESESRGEVDKQGQDVANDPPAKSTSSAADSKPDSPSSRVDMEVDTQEAAKPAAATGKTEDQQSQEPGEDEDKEDPEQARLRRELQANPLTYNGAECDAYFWSQTISEVDVRVKVPKVIAKGKQVKVDIRKKNISVSCQQGVGWSELVSGELEWEVKAEDSMWTLSPGEFVHINLEKKQERWWERVFLGEAGINTRKIDCSRPMTDLDDEAQAKIEEMMYNQRQKQLGLPQSHEAKTHEMLRKAWDAEGSPFKGQPFDPSKFSVDNNGMAHFNSGDS
ncbi:nudc domain-containing protein 3-like [Plakobranchus ocellatus]|uniref:Nudc domain-containing protein 3-like n=1 Tax=Plakobranchus ocellatus TaxID=259542 RepID=A0AAV4A7V5_9GAST|nr:nudc domain-containing protein 3-like [Plakobranchus ocellatus]